MGQAIYLKVKNWERFQQYKDGRPLRWIKLYVKLLGDWEFEQLPETTQLHLIKIWLLAAKHENKIPCDRSWVARQIGARADLDLLALLEDGWLAVRDPHDVENARKLLVEQDVQSRTNGGRGVRTKDTRAGERREEESKRESTEGSSLRSSPSGGEPRVENPPEDDSGPDGEDEADHEREDRNNLAGALRSDALLDQKGPAVESKMESNMSISDQLHEEGYSYAKQEDAVRGARLKIDRREPEFDGWIEPNETFGMGIFRHAEEQGVKLIEVCATYWYKHGETNGSDPPRSERGMSPIGEVRAG